MDTQEQECIFSDIPEVIEDFRKGKFIIIVDDENRENEGDLAIAAEHVTAEKLAFLINEIRGFLCLAIDPAIAQQLELSPMVPENQSRYGTPFTVSVDAAEGITTGVSAHDRAQTIKAMIDDDAEPADLVRPGHVLPLQARTGGTLVRAGHTEAAVDFARIAGLKPAAVICEAMNMDGTMARLPELTRIAGKHGLKICSIVDLIRYRHSFEYLVSKNVSVNLPTKWGRFTLYFYRSKVDNKEHIAICCGDIGSPDKSPAKAIPEPVMVRVHDECFTGDILGSYRCDCGEQLAESLARIQKAGRGVVLYMRQEGRGIGLEHKLHAYALQEQGLDTVEANEKLGFPADKRDYGLGAQILRHLGVRKIKLISNNPRKFNALKGYGLEIVERVPIHINPRKENIDYLRTKCEKMGHLLELEHRENNVEDTGK